MQLRIVRYGVSQPCPEKYVWRGTCTACGTVAEEADGYWHSPLPGYHIINVSCPVAGCTGCLTMTAVPANLPIGDTLQIEKGKWYRDEDGGYIHIVSKQDSRGHFIGLGVNGANPRQPVSGKWFADGRVAAAKFDLVREVPDINVHDIVFGWEP